jgi:hypothetical protein
MSFMGMKHMRGKEMIFYVLAIKKYVLNSNPWQKKILHDG